MWRVQTVQKDHQQQQVLPMPASQWAVCKLCQRASLANGAFVLTCCGKAVCPACTPSGTGSATCGLCGQHDMAAVWCEALVHATSAVTGAMGLLLGTQYSAKCALMPFAQSHQAESGLLALPHIIPELAAEPVAELAAEPALLPSAPFGAAIATGTGVDADVDAVQPLASDDRYSPLSVHEVRVRIEDSTWVACLGVV